MQEYVEELAKLLMTGADDPSKPEHARIVELVDAMVSLASLGYLAAVAGCAVRSDHL